MSLLPVPEEGLGFSMRLFQMGSGDAGKTFSRSHQHHQTGHGVNNLEVRGSTKLRYLLSLPILSTHIKKRN